MVVIWFWRNTEELLLHHYNDLELHGKKFLLISSQTFRLGYKNWYYRGSLTMSCFLLPFLFYFFFWLFFFLLLSCENRWLIVLLYILKKAKNWFLIVLDSYHSTQIVEAVTKSKSKQRRFKVCTKMTWYNIVTFMTVPYENV